MDEFKNPFEPGDLIWFENLGAPIVVFTVLRDDMCREVGEVGISRLLDMIKYYQPIFSGPYRLQQAENWSAYDFGI